MTSPINLNKVRKAKARAEKDRRAAENRVKYGRTKAEKANDALQAGKASSNLDGIKTSDA
ncbi:MAG: DUF4169 family protein [Pseudomonadota bacterium]